MFIKTLWKRIIGSLFYNPQPIDQVPFKQHAQTQTDGAIRVSCAILTDDESQALFDIDLKLRWMQAVWVEVENNSDRPYWLLSTVVDPDYFAPDEVAYSSRFLMSENANTEMVKYFRKLAFSNPIQPGTINSGFIFVNQDVGEKEIDIELIAHERTKVFEFFFSVPGLKAHTFFDTEAQHSVDQVRELQQEELTSTLHNMPRCTTNEDGTNEGDPLNLVIIGNPEDLFPAFVKRGWHLAEETYAGSVLKTIKSFIFGARYRYSPVSPLYLFGRKQDCALQKARGTIHQRNHLRLWITPFKYTDKRIWVGQISRDIGVRLTTKSVYFVTHKIDPDVDEARNGLAEDLLISERLVKVGYVKGVGVSAEENPQKNLTGDPYFTDGMRLVLLLDQRLIPARKIQFFHLDKLPTNGRAVSIED